MKKTLVSIMSMMAMLAMMLTSCGSKYSADNLKGTWVYDDTTIEEDNGQKYEDKLINTYDFRDGTFTQTLEEYIDGNFAYKVKVMGTYNYTEPDTKFEDYSDAVGVITSEYDLESVQVTFGDDVSPEEKEQIQAMFVDKFRQDNLQTKQAKVESENNSDQEKFYGIYVVSIDENHMVIETDKGKQTYIKE